MRAILKPVYLPLTLCLSAGIMADGSAPHADTFADE